MASDSKHIQFHALLPYIGAIVGTFLSVAFIVAFSFSTFYDNAKNDARTIAENSLAGGSRELEDYLVRAESILLLSASSVEHLMQNGASYEELHSMLNRESNRINSTIDPDISGVYGYMYGRYIDGMDWTPPPDYDATARDWYLGAMKWDDVAITSPYVDAETGNICVSLSKAFYDGSNVITMDIFLNRVQGITESMQTNGHGYAFVVDDNGLVIAHSDIGERGKNYREDAAMAELLNVALQDYGSTEMEIGGKPCTVFTNPIGKTWHVALVVDNGELFESVRSVLYRNILVALLVVLMVTAICVFVLRRVSRKTQENERLAREKEIADRSSQAKSEFLANMSHELRTPMNAVLGMNEMILRESDDPEIRAHAADIDNAGRNLLSIINDILDFSRIEAGKMEIVPVDYDISSTINDVINMCMMLAKRKHLTVAVHVDPAIPAGYHGDELRIRQILTNLLNNAVKYTKVGGVSLAVDADGREGDTVKLRFTIKDTGIGIKEEDIPRLFRKFDRLDLAQNRTTEGTGLGLAICYRLAELMGGEISVESIYGKGTAFTVVLPQIAISREPIGNFEERYKKVQAVAAKKNYKAAFRAPMAEILSVDDNKMNLRLLHGLLKKTQVKITDAVSGAEMLEKLRQNHYDLVLLDHMMPEMDGIEALHRAKELDGNPLQHTPVIALTANAIAGSREHYLAAGFDGYLSKPIKTKELEKTLMKFLPPEKVLREG